MNCKELSPKVSRLCSCCCNPILKTTFLKVTQWYRSMATHTRHHASVLIGCVVFFACACSFASLIMWMPPLTFSDTAITNRHSNTTIFQLRAHWVRISWSTGSETLFGHVPGWRESTPPPSRINDQPPMD